MKEETNIPVETVIIMGAAGRDFHNFNVYFRDNPRYRVVAFTAAQIPEIEGRVYPPELCGKLYPEGIPVCHEDELIDLIRKHDVDLVAFSYSDLPHVEVMHKASLVTAHGADFVLIGATTTMLKSTKPVVAVCAVRTGCGKSPTTRYICRCLRDAGHRVVVVRHPMPYGDLCRQAVQRFATYEELELQQCTIEEREEFEPLVNEGIVVHAGIDYEKILRAAEQEAGVIVWDGGNNDTPFFQPDVHIVLVDPHRPGHELTYHPGETNLLMADIAIISKVDTADAEQVATVRRNIEAHAPQATIVLAESASLVDSPKTIHGKRVLVVEDGPTLTHGGMAFGAGMIAAQHHQAAEIVDPRPFLAGTLKDVFNNYPHLGHLLPAMGYNPAQIRDLQETINRTECDLVLCATPMDLSRLLTLNKPTLNVRYEYRDHGPPTLGEILLNRLASMA